MLKFFYFSASFSSEKKEFQEKTSIRNLEKKFLIYPILGPDEDGKGLRILGWTEFYSPLHSALIY